jgi:hypothetical protein
MEKCFIFVPAMENKNKNQPEHPYPLYEEVDKLFKLSVPQQLQKSLQEVYSIYLQNLPTLDFNDVAMDMYLLNRFFENAEKILEEKRRGESISPEAE